MDGTTLTTLLLKSAPPCCLLPRSYSDINMRESVILWFLANSTQNSPTTKRKLNWSCKSKLADGHHPKTQPKPPLFRSGEKRILLELFEDMFWFRQYMVETDTTHPLIYNALKHFFCTGFAV